MRHKKTVATFSSLTYKRLFLGVIWALLCTFALQTLTRYVKETASGTGDGSSWANASSDLQGVIDNLYFGNCINCTAKNIFVAAGTYYPTSNIKDAKVNQDTRTFTFHVKDGISIYGGYDPTTYERNSVVNKTILSGDFYNDDPLPGSVVTSGFGENAYHVVTCRGGYTNGKGITVDGFYIKGGNANSATTINSVNNVGLDFYGLTISNDVGGGIIIVNGDNKINIKNNYIHNNSAIKGGGIYNFEGTNTVNDNYIYSNSATIGGGVYNFKGTSIIYNNTIYNNSAVSYGGGIYNILCTYPAGISHNRIYNNLVTSSDGEGGGIFTYNGTNSISGNSLSANSARYGGGISTYQGTNTVYLNTISGNSATSFGGGIYTYEGTNTVYLNTISGNSSMFNGGGISIFESLSTLTNNTFSGNSASSGGGGININAGTNTLINNTFSGNSASYGGGIQTSNGTNTLTNNIFWDNKKSNSTTVLGADYYANSTNGNTFKNNLLQLESNNYPVSASGSYAIGTAATGNLFALNPNFVNATDIDGADNIHRTADDGLQLTACSPSIDAGLTNLGTPNIIPTYDIVGNTVYNSLKDMGAYERQSARSILPTTFQVTGGGNICGAISNVEVGLSGSETGVTYQLIDANNANVGTAKDGTGAAINFGFQTVGTYTVLATKTNNGCKLLMKDKSVVTSIYCCPSGTILYVNASVSGGNSNGTSWENAYASLSDALFVAHKCSIVKTIKVAAGTYKPTRKEFLVTGTEKITTDDRDVTFHIPKNVTIEGGYNATTGDRGTEGGSILSGDIGLVGVTTDNAYHVVYAVGVNLVGVKIDGFSITGGYANGNGSNGKGGGIYIYSGGNQLINNTIYGNSATYGGGVYTDEGTNILTNSTIYDNSAGDGGGININSGTGNNLTNNTII
jgi:hypothetical protein